MIDNIADFAERLNAPGANLDEAWERYHNPHHPWHKALRERFAWVASHIRGPRFLDVGCSNGVGLLVASGVSGVEALTGVDLCRAMIGQAAKNLASVGLAAGITLIVAPAEALPLANESFDTVFMGEVLEHVLNVERAVAEAVRVLRHGGRLIVTVPDGGKVSKDHLRTFRAESIGMLCADAGIEMRLIHAMPAAANHTWLCLVGRKR